MNTQFRWALATAAMLVCGGCGAGEPAGTAACDADACFRTWWSMTYSPLAAQLIEHRDVFPSTGEVARGAAWRSRPVIEPAWPAPEKASGPVMVQRVGPYTIVSGWPWALVLDGKGVALWAGTRAVATREAGAIRGLALFRRYGFAGRWEDGDFERYGMAGDYAEMTLLRFSPQGPILLLNHRVYCAFPAGSSNDPLDSVLDINGDGTDEILTFELVDAGDEYTYAPNFVPFSKPLWRLTVRNALSPLPPQIARLLPPDVTPHNVELKRDSNGSNIEMWIEPTDGSAAKDGEVVSEGPIWYRPTQSTTQPQAGYEW